MKELQDQLEAEQYFSRLYKTQSNDAKEELEEKVRYIQDLEEERSNLMHQLQIALARADSEALARSIAEETVADLEKEKTMKELEHKDLITKHRNELSTKEGKISNIPRIKYINLKNPIYSRLAVVQRRGSGEEQGTEQEAVRDRWPDATESQDAGRTRQAETGPGRNGENES